MLSGSVYDLPCDDSHVPLEMECNNGKKIEMSIRLTVTVLIILWPQWYTWMVSTSRHSLFGQPTMKQSILLLRHPTGFDSVHFCWMFALSMINH